MFLPGIAAMLLMPLVLYFLSPPEIKSTPNAFTFMGWSFGLVFGISLDATSVALLGLSLVLISGVLTFGEVLAEKAAWNIFSMVFSSCNDGNFTWQTWCYTVFS